MIRQINNRYVAILGVGIAVILLVIACGPSAKAPAQEATGGSGVASGPVGKAVVTISAQTTGTVDPIQAGGSDFTNIQGLYNRLTETLLDSLKRTPGIATEWSMSPDGLTWEFKIRKGVKFHNGDEVTPEDVVFSINRVPTLGEPPDKAAHQIRIESVEAQGDKVVIRLKRPDWTFLSFISGAIYSVLPKKYVQQVGDDGLLKSPVGTGHRASSEVSSSFRVDCRRRRFSMVSVLGRGPGE